MSRGTPYRHLRKHSTSDSDQRGGGFGAISGGRPMRQIPKAGLALFIVTLAGCSRSEGPRFQGFTFSPEAKYILSPYDRSGSTFIYKIALNSGKAARFTKPTNGFKRSPSFSPAANRIPHPFSLT